MIQGLSDAKATDIAASIELTRHICERFSLNFSENVVRGIIADQQESASQDDVLRQMVPIGQRLGFRLVQVSGQFRTLSDAILEDMTVICRISVGRMT